MVKRLEDERVAAKEAAELEKKAGRTGLTATVGSQHLCFHAFDTFSFPVVRSAVCPLSRWARPLLCAGEGRKERRGWDWVLVARMCMSVCVGVCVAICVDVGVGLVSNPESRSLALDHWTLNTNPQSPTLNHQPFIANP